MAKYRKASEKTISRGKGKSTDQLSLADAKEYFNSRAKETGAKRFRWNGDVYDLRGNKISEPARSSGGSSRASAKDDGPKRPKANPARQPGGARPEPGKAGGMPAANKDEAKGKSANPAAVAAMGAGAVAAGVAAARSGRGPGAGRSQGTNAPKNAPALSKPEARLALPAPNKGGTVIPENKKPKALPKPEKPKSEVKSGKGRGAGGLGTGVRVTGGNPARRITRGGRVLQMPDVMSYQFMNKGGLVKKK